jgi:hypothetical protein
LIVVSAGISLLPQWAALAAGAAVGLLVPLVQYVVDHVLRLDDPTSAIAMHGIPSLGGLLLLGAWDPGAQLQAQLTGSITALLVAFVPSWLLFAAVQGLTRGWQEGYALRLPRPRRRADRPRRRAKPRPARQAPPALPPRRRYRGRSVRERMAQRPAGCQAAGSSGPAPGFARPTGGSRRVWRLAHRLPQQRRMASRDRARPRKRRVPRSWRAGGSARCELA